MAAREPLQRHRPARRKPARTREAGRSSLLEGEAGRRSPRRQGAEGSGGEADSPKWPLHEDPSSGLGSARLGSARLGSARLGSARLGSARLGSARLGSARLGSARLGSARLGSARLGSARLGGALYRMAVFRMSREICGLREQTAQSIQSFPPPWFPPLIDSGVGAQPATRGLRSSAYGLRARQMRPRPARKDSIRSPCHPRIGFQTPMGSSATHEPSHASIVLQHRLDGRRIGARNCAIQRTRWCWRPPSTGTPTRWSHSTSGTTATRRTVLASN